MILAAFVAGFIAALIFGVIYGIRWERDRKAENQRMRELIALRRLYTVGGRLLSRPPEWARRATTEVM